jgi:glycosyltransferase involved in cell wall biosynthesis
LWLLKNFLDALQYKRYYDNLDTMLLLPPVKSGEVKRVTVKALASLYERYFSTFDILHLNDIYSPYNYLIVDNMRPKIITFHEGTLAEERRPEKLNFIDDILSHMDAITTPSKFMSGILQKKLGYRSIVIPFGVDRQLFNTLIPKFTARERLRIPKERKVILWSGRLIPEKELETLVDAIPTVASEFPSSIFLIIGRKSGEKNYTKRVLKYVRREKKASSNIVLKTNYVAYRQMPLYYRSADVFVHTSRVEAFGLVFVEAMACGLPIIATNTDTCREIIDKSELLFEPGDSQTLAEKICRLLADDELRVTLGEAARQKVCKEYTWSKAADQFLDLYSRLI